MARPASPGLSMPPEVAAREIAHRLALDEQMFALSGLGGVYERSLSQMAQISQDDEVDPDQITRAVAASRDAAAPAYASKQLLVDVEAHLSGGSPAHLGAAVAYLRSTSADRLAVLRAELGTGPGQQRMARYLALLRQGPLDATLESQAERLLTAERELDLTVLMTWDAARRYAQLLAEVLPPAPEDEAVRDAFKGSARHRLKQTALYLAANAERETFDEHLRFWESPAGRWLAKARVDAVEEALRAAEVRAAGRVSIWIAAQKQNGTALREEPISALIAACPVGSRNASEPCSRPTRPLSSSRSTRAH